LPEFVLYTHLLAVTFTPLSLSFSVTFAVTLPAVVVLVPLKLIPASCGATVSSIVILASPP